MIISVYTAKGGTGKTSVAVNLSAALAIAKHPTLLVDFDPQCNATFHCNAIIQEKKETIYDVLNRDVKINNAVQHVETIRGLSILPGSPDMGEVDNANPETLITSLKAITRDFEYIILDLPPSRDVVAVMALASSEGVLSPIQAEPFGLRGLSDVEDQLEEISRLGFQVSLRGIVLNMYDRRRVFAQTHSDVLKEIYGDLLVKTTIRRAMAVPHASGCGLPVVIHRPKAPVSDDYRKLAKVVARWKI